MKNLTLKTILEPRFLLTSALSLALTLALLSGSALGLDASSTYRTTNNIYADGTARFLKLNNGGSTTLNFSTSGSSTTVVILFNAECAVESTDETTFYDIDIVVDGLAVPPTDGNDNALCTSQGEDGNLVDLANWITSGFHVVKTVGGGSHTVKVRGKLYGFSSGDRVWIDDIILTVLK